MASKSATTDAPSRPVDDDAAARPLRKDAARNREALIASAREVFADRGLDASLDDVARHAGLGVGTAYRHFANKHELASALIQQAIDEIIGAVQHALTVDDSWQALVGFIETSMQAQARDRGLRQVLMGVHDPAKMTEIQEQLIGPLEQLVESAHAQGSLRPEATATDIGAIFVMLGAVVDAFGESSPSLWQRYLAVLLDGLRPGSTSPLPVEALGSAEFGEAMAAHKQMTNCR
jgi:AcrR family transcriptional regulator